MCVNGPIHNVLYTHQGILFSLKIKTYLTPATTWRDLEDMMLRAIRQTSKNKHCVIPLTSLEESGSPRLRIGGGEQGSGEGGISV